MSHLDLISIETKSFRKFFRELCDEYGKELTIKINGKRYTTKDREWLISTWCNRKHLQETINFSVILNSDEIFGFHDSPDNLWADKSQLPFVLKLNDMKIVKYEYADYPKPDNFIQKIMWYFKPPKPIRRYRG